MPQINVAKLLMLISPSPNKLINIDQSHNFRITQLTFAMIKSCLNCAAPFFFPGLFFYVYIESPNPKNPEGPTPQAQQLKTLTPKTQYKTPTPKPQTPNHHK